MGEQDPPAVRRAPGERHVVIPEWKVAVTHGTTDVVATGRLEWIPGPNPLPWVALIAVLIGALVAASFLLSWGVVLAIAVVLLVVGDAVHSYGLAWATAGSTGVRIGRLFGGSLFNIMLWVVALVSLRPLIRKQDIGLLPAAIAGLFIALFGGLLDVGGLYRSTVPFAWSADLARALVATTIGLGLGVAAASVIVLYRTGSLFPPLDDIDVPAATSAPRPSTGDPGPLHVHGHVVRRSDRRIGLVVLRRAALHARDGRGARPRPPAHRRASRRDRRGVAGPRRCCRLQPHLRFSAPLF